ncbi:MAG TPA: hypothetical protein VN213_04120 [Solirubrobacteraceae bacterium]|nr:hypothetical protein [Solirubrobacteraceae bacterium]
MGHALAWWEVDGANNGLGAEAERLLAAVNFGTVPVELRLPAEMPTGATLVMSTDPDRARGEADLGRFVLLASEAVLLLMPARPRSESADGAHARLGSADGNRAHARAVAAGDAGTS